MNDTPNLDPLAHSPDSAAKRIGTNTRAIYNLLASGELRSFKLGKRRLIPDAELQSFIERRMAEGAAA